MAETNEPLHTTLDSLSLCFQPLLSAGLVGWVAAQALIHGLQDQASP